MATGLCSCIRRADSIQCLFLADLLSSGLLPFFKARLESKTNNTRRKNTKTLTTSSRTAQAKHRRRTPDGRFADELNSFGFPDAATLSAYEQQTSQIPVLQRLQQHGKITPPPITLPDGWAEAGTKHDGNADGYGSYHEDTRRFTGPDNSTLTVTHSSGFEKDFGLYDYQTVEYQSGNVTIKRIIPPTSNPDINELEETGQRLERQRAELNAHASGRWSAPITRLTASTSETGYTFILPEYGEPPKKPVLPWNRAAWDKTRKQEKENRKSGVAEIPPR